MAKTYDAKCYELAEHFMQDDPSRASPAMFKYRCHSLALDIQQAVEDWFDAPAIASTDGKGAA
jgi:hypothetical protein